MPINIRGPLPRWVYFLVLSICGIGLIYFAHSLKEKLGIVSETLRDAGIAAVTASILGFTIDRWIKADLAKDVFQVAVGYIFPTEFREEIRRILAYRFICEKHHLIVDIEDIGEGCARVTSKYERKFRNITSSSAPIKGIIHMDEWGFTQEKSKIIEYQLILEDGTVIVADPHNVRTDANISPSLLLETEEKHISAKRTATVCVKWLEIRRTNDEISINFGSPTINPEIEVNAHEFDFMVEFGTEGEIGRARYSPRQTLNGTYFPGQKMRVRFWPRRISVAN